MERIIALFKAYGGIRYVDESFLRKITEIAVSNDGSEEFLKNGVTTTEKAPMLFAQAAYEKGAGKIHYYYDDMLKWQEYEVHVYYPDKDKLTHEQEILLVNLLMIETALHEIEHVNQEKKKHEDIGIEGMLLRLGEGKKETTGTYETIPSERLAEIVSWRKIIDIASSLKNVSPEMMRYLEKMYKDSMLRGYEKLDGTLGSPVNDYLAAHGESNIFMSLEEALQQYPDVEQRIMYGLPITPEEYECYKTDTRSVTKADIARADVEAKFSLKEVGKKILEKLLGKERSEHGI